MAYVRVRDNGTGHEFSKPEEWVDALLAREPKAITVLKGKDAVGADGSTPIPVKYRESVEDAGARRTGTPRRRTTKKSTAKRAAKKAATAPAAPTSPEETSA